MRNSGKLRDIWLLVSLVCFGWALSATAPRATAARVRIACVGDSITWGYTITHDRLARAWPGVLQKLVGKKYKSDNFGHSGATLLKKGNLPYWTTPEFKAATKFDPNIVIIMLGTNDTKPKNWKKYGSQFTANAESLIRHFEHLQAHPKIYICTPPPVVRNKKHGVRNPWGINEKVLVHGVIPAIKRAARAMHIPVVHLHGLMMKRATEPMYKYFAHDGVHPDPLGQALMGKIIYRAVFQ